MIAEISVHETEVDKVRVGQPATIIMDAFPDKVLEGEVTEVASLPDQQRGFMNPDLKVYKTMVRINGTHDFLKSRMSCKVNILVENLEDVIVVPIQVVSNRGGRKVCYVVTPQGPEERVVQTGLFNDTFVQVIEGLEEGSEVMLNPPLFSELGTPDSFQQQQPIPQRRPGESDANDTEAQRPRRGGRAGRAEGGQGTPRSRAMEGGGRQQSEGPPRVGGLPQGGRQPQGQGAQRQQGDGQFQPGQFQLTDDRIEQIMSRMKQFDPDNAKKLEELRKSDPEKFKSELRKNIQSMFNKMRQGGGGMRPPGQGGGGMRQGQGGSDMRQGPGNAGNRQNR